jgi:quercetin dioxygenase-like cupin family protein
MLGQIELGQSAPTVRTLWHIATTLDVSFATLISVRGPRGPRKLPLAESKTLSSRDGRFTSRALFPFEGARTVEFYELHLDAHATERADGHQPGTHENLVVVRGTIELTIGEDRHELAPGDAIFFPADQEHTYANRGARPALMYLVMTYADEVGR